MKYTFMNGIIVILGSPNDDNGNISQITIERCTHAIEIYKKNQNYKFLLTGGFGEHFNRTDKPHTFYAKKYLVSAGIPKNNFIESAKSANTIEDIKISKKIIEKYTPDCLIIVTSDFHYKRTKFLLKNILKDRPFELDCSKTHLPQIELLQIQKHEKRALNKLITGIY
jgi:uncharacterized SAM-binding protein YcdF (DUF218 family)